MTKRIIISLAMIALTVAGVSGATIAYFTDTAESAGNTLAMGTLDINFDSSALPVHLANMQPGAEQQMQFNVKNAGSLSAILQFMLSVPGIIHRLTMK